MGRKRKIITDLTKLSERCDETVVADKELTEKIVNSITDILQSDKNLLCLSAPQIGFQSRVFGLKFNSDDGVDIKIFINPMIVESKGVHLSRETNISIPDKEYIMIRNDEIRVTYQLIDGKVDSNLFKGFASDLFQQMINMLDGVLISDIGLEVLEGWDETTEEERESIINLYIESLKSESEDFKKEIQENPELKQVDDAINFMTDVVTGKVKLVNTERKPNRAERRALEKLKKKLDKKK